jgi:hypothetical protein
MFNIFEDAVWFGRQMEEQGFFRYEVSMDHFNMTALARLADELKVPWPLPRRPIEARGMR